MSEKWIADRMHQIDASGIRKVFDLAANMMEPINLSIGQPHYDTPDVVKNAFKQAIDNGKNAYSQTQGIAPLIDEIQQSIDERYSHSDRKTFITSGTSGGLMLALCTLVNPGDEVIFLDPFFVMYKHLVTLAGGVSVIIDSYPDFQIPVQKIKAAITDKTKVIICNSPANPTGAVASRESLEQLAQLAKANDIALISDEIYSAFCYDVPFSSPAQWNEQTIVIDGFSKSHSMTGHRVGFCHGPSVLIQQMAKLQQFTFVCAPHPAQWAVLAGLDYNLTEHVDQYRRNRDYLMQELNDFDIQGAGGAFYMFVRSPWGSGTEFVKAAIEKNLLIIPGNVFSDRDTHFRISFAADESTVKAGARVLRDLAEAGC